MDPLSITAGALGITHFALLSIGRLRDLIDGLDEVKDVLEGVTSELEAIQRPLAALENLQISDRTTHAAVKQDLERTGVADSVNKCGQACATLAEKLEGWTKHSRNGKFSLRDRLSVGLWNKEKIRTFRLQVHTCQAIVQLAINSAQLIVLVRSENASETARHETEKQLQSLRSTLQAHIRLMESERENTLQRRHELESTADDDEDGNDEAKRTLAIQETEKQSRLLEANQDASGIISEILSDLSTLGARNTYKTVFSGSHNKGIQIGHSTGTINWNGSHA